MQLTGVPVKRDIWGGTHGQKLKLVDNKIYSGKLLPPSGLKRLH